MAEDERVSDLARLPADQKRESVSAMTERPQNVRSAKVTVNDVARLAGVSKKTVSRVINESPLVGPVTRDKVKKLIAETGYTPDPQSRALAFRKSFLIGMVYDNPSPQYIVNMQRGILDALEDSGFQLVLCPCDRGDSAVHEKILRFVAQQRPFGVILSPSISEDESLCRQLQALDCAYVRIASVEFDAPHQNIRTHDAEGAAQAARHLARIGHTRIAHVHGVKTFRSAHERLEGFSRGLREFSLTLDPKYVLEGAYNFESGVACTEKLLHMNEPPTAIFLGNDEMAVGAYQAIRAAGLRVPDDISVVGFDDTPMAARVWPPMTTVRLPIRDMGGAAARLLINADAAGDERISFMPEIVVRQSTAPPKS